MAKIKKFGKVINDNSVAMAIYKEQQSYFDEIKELEKQENINFITYVKMEGMYAIGTAPDYCGGQGSRGYTYKYANQEIKAKEDAERENYKTEYITPLTKRIKELKNKADVLEDSLCIAIWGFSKEEYSLRKRLASAEKKLAYQLSYVESLREELKNLH